MANYKIFLASFLFIFQKKIILCYNIVYLTNIDSIL